MIVRSDGWQWAWNGKAENQPPDLFPKTVWPENQLRYNGHYPWGDETVISYSVQGRPVLESPTLERMGKVPVIHHRLSIRPGSNSLELIVLDDLPEIRGKPPLPVIPLPGSKRRMKGFVFAPVRTASSFSKFHLANNLFI